MDTCLTTMIYTEFPHYGAAGCVSARTEHQFPVNNSGDEFSLSFCLRNCTMNSSLRSDPARARRRLQVAPAGIPKGGRGSTVHAQLQGCCAWCWVGSTSPAPGSAPLNTLSPVPGAQQAAAAIIESLRWEKTSQIIKPNQK